jgi:hypothetical protein
MTASSRQLKNDGAQAVAHWESLLVQSQRLGHDDQGILRAGQT